MDADLRFTYISDNLERILGVAPERHYGKTREDFLGNDYDRDAWNEHLKDLQEHRPFRNFEYLRIGDGVDPKWLRASGVPVFAEDGAFLGFRGTGSDITERKMAERDAAAARARLEDAIESISEGFILFDADERLVLCNQNYRDMYSAAKDVLTPGTKLTEVICEPVIQSVYRGVDNADALVRQRLEAYRIGTGSHELHLADGQWVLATERRTREGGFVGIRTDISEFKRHQQELSESEERFRDIAETASDWFWETDRDFCFTWVSFDEHPINGAPGSSLLGLRPWTWSGVALEDPHAWNRLLETCLEDKQPIRNFVVRAKFSAIGIHDISINAVPIFDEHGVFHGYRGASTDVTQQILTEEQLRQALKMEAIGQLTGGVAHDFNNLLAVTLPNAQMLEAELEDRDDLLAMARSIITASQHGAELTHRLLAFSRRQSLQPKTIDLGLLCSEMNGLLRLSLGETFKIELIARDKSLNVLADPGQVENALLNLALNASHAMPRGGTLTITVEHVSVTSQEWAERWQGQPGEYVALGVADTGTGMTADVLSHVFEPFFTTKSVGQGSGLGLSMVYGFAQQSGGFVAIDSEEGKGTTVMIYLPKAPANQTVTNARTPDADLGNGRGETVLVVEDAVAVRNATIMLLEKLGYTALTAEDAASALEVASSGERIDLLISDIALPGGLNGIEICNRIRELRPGLKCLFMTGYSTVSDEDLPEGTEILSKPVSISDFSTKVSQVLEA